MLVDSSAWIPMIRRGEFFERAGEDGVAICPPVAQELLQGAMTPASYDKLLRAIRSATMLDAPMPLVRFEEAAQIYLQCRAAGYTIRSSVDCLIAACAIAHGVPLLHDDRDFDNIAAVSALEAVRV